MKRTPIYIAIFVLFTLACLCSSQSPSTTPQKVGDNTTVPNAGPTTPAVQIYKIGNVIQVGTSTVALNSATIDASNMLHANFTIENKGSKELNVSSMLLFEAKGNDGTKLEQEFIDCESGGLDGTILPGDKLKGNICWHGVTTDSVKIYYQANLFSSSQNTVVWEIKK